jgi:hypothetical protein
MVAVGGVFAGMGARIGSAYGVQVSAPVLKEMGVAVAKGIGGVLAASFVGTGLLKYVPGVNLWVALLVQPPMVAAVAYAAGRVFKLYYHTIILEGRELSTAEIGELAKSTLSEKLESMRESGPSVSSHERPSQAPRPIEERPPFERQLIALANPQHKAGECRSLGDHVSPLRFVTREEAEKVRLPPGHPRDRTVYVAHPLKRAVYYLAADFHIRLFEDKVLELARMLRYLGATYLRIVHVEGYDTEVEVTGKAGLDHLGLDIGAKAGAGYKRQSGSEIIFELALEGSASPELAKDMVWYEHEDVWKEIAEGRIRDGTTTFSVDIQNQEDFGINASLEGPIKLLQIGLGGTFRNFKKTQWHVSGTFKKLIRRRKTLQRSRTKIRHRPSTTRGSR